MPTQRKRRPTREIAIETWTWQQAEEALAKNATNRRLRENDVEKYARSMASKLWGPVCTEPIVFDWDGNLINGQHRLHAQVKSRTKQEWIIYRNVPPEVQKVIDTGILRSPADALKYEGYANTIVLASVSRWAWLLEQGQINSGRYKISTEEILDMNKRHPDLVHSAAMGVYARSSGWVEVNPTPIGAAHWWIAQHNDHTEADLFIDRMVHMNREPDGSPILALLQRFNNAKREGEHIQTRIQIATMVKAWNYDVRRIAVTRSLNTRFRGGVFKLQDVLKREISQELANPVAYGESGELPDPEDR